MRVHLILLLLTLWVVVPGTQGCTAPEQQQCDFVCDCTNCEDELDCGYMGEPFVCDFEKGECGWTDHSFNAPYKWELRQRGDAFTDTGPSSDFTTGTATGWFMAVTAVKSEQGSFAALVSPEMKQSAPTCQLSLRYFMWDSGHTGLGTAPLWVSVRYRDNEEAVLWRPEPSSVRGWKEAAVFVGRIPSEFRLVFYSEREQGSRGDVAVDQLHFLHCALPAPPETECANGTLKCVNGACVEERLACDGTDDCGDGTDEEDCGEYHRCDFDDGLCGMWNLSSLSNLKWVRTNQKSISTTDPMKGPGRDHSTNTAAGHFLYVTVPESGLEMDWAAFQSNLLEPTSSAAPCRMVMYTHQFGPRSGGLTVLVTEQTIYPVWERGGALGDLWVRAEVEIVSDFPFQILIMAAIRNFDYGGIGVDSIVLSPECRKSSETVPWAKFPQSPKDPCTSPDKMCDFHVDCDKAEDEDKCGDFTYSDGHKGWTDCSIGNQGWQKKNSTSTEVQLYVAEATGQQRTEAQTKTPLLGPSGPACTLSFDFALTGASRHIGELSVRVVDSLLGPQPKVWEFGGKTGTEPESWNQTVVHIGRWKTRFQLAFEAELAALHDASEIKVKNVVFRDCNENYYPYSPTGVNCNFEEGLCGWYQDNNDNFDWTLLTGMDHTIHVGRSLVVDLWSPSLRGAFGRILSYTLEPSATDMCLSFFYKLYGPNTGSLNVKLVDDHGYELTLWSRTGAHGNMWHEAHCPVPHQLTPFRLMFEVVRSGFDGRVALDDVAFTDTPCTSLSRMCSFEGDRCGFGSSGPVHWRHGNGLMTSPSGPKDDHTLETSLGYYMMVNSGSDVLPSGAVSTLTSPLYYGTSRTECLQFWYHMGGDSPGSLTVYMKPVKGERVKIFSNSLNQGDVWRHGTANISSGLLDWQIVLDGVKGSSGFVALDDIEYTVGVDCTGKETDSIKKGRQPDAGGIAASVIVVLLLIATLMALLVYYLRTRRGRSAGATGFHNDSYEPDLTQDHISVPRAQNHPMAAGFNHFPAPDDFTSVEQD